MSNSIDDERDREKRESAREEQEEEEEEEEETSSKSTSPTTFFLPFSPSTKLMPTSMTAAPGLIQLPRTNLGTPAADTTMSAHRTELVQTSKGKKQHDE